MFEAENPAGDRRRLKFSPATMPTAFERSSLWWLDGHLIAAPKATRCMALAPGIEVPFGVR
jgi:hypothetical protein